MARKHQLRKLRTDTVIHVTSKKQESDIIRALQQVVEHLDRRFGKKISLAHEKQWYLKDIVAELSNTYPDMEFHTTAIPVRSVPMEVFSISAGRPMTGSCIQFSLQRPRTKGRMHFELKKVFPSKQGATPLNDWGRT